MPFHEGTNNTKDHEGRAASGCARDGARMGLAFVHLCVLRVEKKNQKITALSCAATRQGKSRMTA
jgi:hypothetical protein